MQAVSGPILSQDSGQASADTVTALHGHTGHQQSWDGQPATSAPCSTLTTAKIQHSQK